MFTPTSPTFLSFALLASIPFVTASPARTIQRRAPSERRCKASTAPLCTQYATGVLAADVKGALEPFTLVDPLGSISFNEDETRPLEVVYESCKSFANPKLRDGDIPGRLFVPEFQTCIKVLNQADTEEPYFTLLSNCDSSFGEHFVLRDNSAIYWTGSTNATFDQGGCGELVYRSEEDGTPVLTENGVPLACEGTPFRLILDSDTD